MSEAAPIRERTRGFFANLGPGLITGAADDDPSGISTYAVTGLSMTIGMAMNGFGLNAVAMLLWSAVLNGLLAPPLILPVLPLTSDKKVMGEHSNKPLLRALGWVTVVAMGFCAVASILFWVVGATG